MTDDRLNYLMLMAVESEVVKCLNLEIVVEFSKLKKTTLSLNELNDCLLNKMKSRSRCKTWSLMLCFCFFHSYNSR